MVGETQERRIRVLFDSRNDFYCQGVNIGTAGGGGGTRIEFAKMKNAEEDKQKQISMN